MEDPEASIPNLLAVSGTEAGAAEDDAGAHQQVLGAYRLHGGSLYRLAMAESRDPELARDAVQEAFLRLFRYLLAGGRVDSVRAWLARVALNYLRDEARRAARDAPLGRELSAPAHALPDDPSALVESVRALLTPRERQCVELRLIGYRYEEIAQSLGIRCGTVSSLLSRAARKLAKARKEGR